MKAVRGSVSLQQAWGAELLPGAGSRSSCFQARVMEGESRKVSTNSTASRSSMTEARKISAMSGNSMLSEGGVRKVGSCS